jgi:fatty-acyl-CoA synthase
MIPEYPSKTTGEVFNEASNKYANNEAIVFKEVRINYATFRRKVDALAKSLIRIGIKKGDKVSILISNRPEIFYSQYAIAKIGAISVFVNTRFKVHEISHILREADISAFILMDQFLNIDYWPMLNVMLPGIEEAKPGQLENDNFPFLKSIIIYSEKGRRYPGTFDFKELINFDDKAELENQLLKRELSVNSNDIATILFTSGTTGFPKGAMLTHNNILWHNAYAYPIKSKYSSNDRHMVPNPIATAGGSTAISVTDVSTGSTSVLVEKFDPSEVLKLIEVEKITVLHGVPAMYQMYLEEASIHNYRLSSLKKAFIAGDYCSSSLAERIRNEITEDLIIGYGQTEASVLICQTSLDDPYEKQINTVGKPYEGLELKICSPESRETLSIDEIGEICVRGPTVMLGYYKKPIETQHTIDKDQWLHTGDLGSLDNEGYLSIKGRIREMFITGGFNNYPLEIEQFLQSHPKVKVAKVVPIPDHKLIEVPGAIIELKEKAICTEEEIIKFCKERIANYKIPRYLKFVNEWPMIAIGKVDKLSLKNGWIQELKLKSLL